MEPKILLVGRNLEVMEILKSELEKFDRNVETANSEELLDQKLRGTKFDFVVVGAGLPDQVRKDMGAFIKAKNDNLPIHMIERKQGGKPADMIDFTNEKAVMWKVEKIIGPMPERK